MWSSHDKPIAGSMEGKGRCSRHGIGSTAAGGGGGDSCRPPLNSGKAEDTQGHVRTIHGIHGLTARMTCSFLSRRTGWRTAAPSAKCSPPPSQGAR
eukprot:scaffold2520_cov130-Isochrysis_galbana.AAC.3